jgi:glycosyltransferase involved in cell wall biosynthesis
LNAGAAIFSDTPHPANAREQPAILQIVPNLDTGGAERTTIDIAGALARAGFLPLVATKGGRMLDELRAAGGEWIAMPVDAKSPQTLAANVLRLRSLIRRRNIRLVHARSRAPAWSAFWAARLATVPFVTTYHGAYNAHSGLKRFYNSVMARGDAVIANSEWTAAHIGREYRFRPKRLAVIPRGVDFRRFDPAEVSAEQIRALRASWDVQPGEALVLLPGRLTRWKGQTVFIDALARLKHVHALSRVRAVLAGDSQGRSGYESELRQLIEINALNGVAAIVGHVGDMPAAYLAADIVVSASTDPEAFGRVAAEAGAMGRPVIATNHGGAREIVLPGRSGLLVAPGDAGELAAALRTLLEASDGERAAMGATARAHIAEHYTVERMCADTLTLYRDLLVGRK